MSPFTCNHFHKPLTILTKPCKNPTSNSLLFPSSYAKSHPLLNYYDYKKSQHHPTSHPPTSLQKTKKNPSLEPKQFNQRLESVPFTEEFKWKIQPDPVEKLKKDGDWSKQQFWDVIRFLKKSSRTNEILQVFDFWKDLEGSRINEENYGKIMGLLFEDGLTDASISAFKQMKSHGIRPSLETYNLLIDGFSRMGQFDEALFYIDEMKGAGLKPNAETYHGLIEAYGKYRMYDEMGRCLREMESSGCSPDHVTYNLLIREFSKAGLLNKMESTYRALLSKKMILQSSTSISVLETYANFGILDKMEKAFKRVLNSKACLREDLIRKLARVYIENLMFSRLDDLGLDLSTKTGCTDIVWCLRLLSHACSLSKKGMYSIIQEMESIQVPWNVTVANIMALAYLKMKDFTQLEVLLSELPSRYVKPDIVTLGVLCDASMSGFRGTRVKRVWTRTGFFDDTVEMNTDALVLIAFSRGQFLRDVEEMFSLVEAKNNKNRTWTYYHLIYSVETYCKTRLIDGKQIQAEE